MQFNLDQQRSKNWFERASIAADLVVRAANGPTEHFTVADLGCGDEKLRAMLENVGFRGTYRGYDLIPQLETTLQLDIESQMPDQLCDIVVLIGVTEYLSGLSETLENIAGYSPRLITSHVLRDRSSYSEEQIVTNGWINHLSCAEMEALLEQSGWTVITFVTTANARTGLWLASRRNHSRSLARMADSAAP